jgi:glycosyltransferase involved in cell wall biosynthesis
MSIDATLALAPSDDPREAGAANPPSSEGRAPTPPARLNGIRVACFYPWAPFEPTGSWSRFACLWRYLAEEGAGVTLAFLERGNNAQLKGVSVRYLGEDNVINNIGAFARPMVAAKAQSELKDYSSEELNFLLMYEKGLYLHNPKAGPWLDEIVSGQDVVTCEYPMYAPLLSEYCKKWRKPLVVTSHDMLFELHGYHPGAKQRLKYKEVQALGLADGLVFCNDQERRLFAEHGLKGETVLNTGDVLAVTPGREDESRNAVRAALKIKTAHYCLFVGSAHGPNLEAASEMRRIGKSMPDMTFVVAGNCHAKAAEHNFIAIGRASEPWLDTLYRGAFAILVPLTRGTGISVKVFEAFTYGKPIVSTPVGARGHDVADGRELLIAATPLEFSAAIRRLLAEGELRQALGGAARKYAERLDFRTHFQPYGDLIGRLTQPGPVGPPKAGRALVLVDNNLSDRVGHHFNYALALKDQCSALGRPFRALVKETAPAEVRASLSAEGVFSQGIHEDSSSNPYPPEWGSLRSTYDFLRSNEAFARELEVGLARTARPFDHVFLPNATPRQILGLALLIRKNPIYRTQRFSLLLRYTTLAASGLLKDRKTTLDKDMAEQYATAFEKLREADPSGCVRIASDSAGLAKEFAALAQKPIEVWPIPHTLHSSSGSCPSEIPAKTPGKIRLVYLGDAREEKGFELLPAAVRACMEDASLSSVEFVFQALVSSRYHARMGLVIGELERLQAPNLHLIQSSLSPDAYRALLESADLVLLPYDAATYRSRTSGPFVEAICAGKPVVIPRDSWMSAQLEGSRAGVTFKSGSGPDLEQALRSALAALPDHARAAGELSRRFSAYHNPRSFVAHLCPETAVP